MIDVCVCVCVCVVRARARACVCVRLGAYVFVCVCWGGGYMRVHVSLFSLKAKIRERVIQVMMPATERETAWPMDLMGYFRKY